MLIFSVSFQFYKVTEVKDMSYFVMRTVKKNVAFQLGLKIEEKIFSIKPSNLSSAFFSSSSLNLDLFGLLLKNCTLTLVRKQTIAVLL